MGAFLGALTSLGIGGSDMFGRRVTAATSPVTASAVMQLFAALVSLVAITFVSSQWLWGDVWLGAVSGLGMGSGLACYFGGLERSSSAVVAPVVATLSAVIPYIYTLLTGTSPDAFALVGALAALAGLLLVTASGSSRERVRAGLVWGLASGLSYGFALTVVIETSSDSGVWPSVSQRVVAVLLMLGVAGAIRVQRIPPSGLRVTAALAGFFAGVSSLAYIAGVQVDAQPAVVTAGLFPIASVAGGRIFYGDEVTATQVLGIAVALLGVTAVVLA